MRIVIRKHNGDLETREVSFGTKLVGLRITEVTFTSRQELLLVRTTPKYVESIYASFVVDKS